MPSYCLKLDKEHNAYVLFSTVVDGVVSDVLDRDQMFKELLNKRGGLEEMIEAALVRADISGSSSKHGDYSWGDGNVLFLDGGATDTLVPRDKLYEYVVGKENN